MSVRVPEANPYYRQLKSASYPFLSPMLLNELSIERTLTSLIELLAKQGRMSKTGSADVDQHLGRVEEMLLKEEWFSGFNPDDVESIDGWLRAEALRLNKKGKAKRGEVLDFAKPVTGAAYRLGLPSERSRLRNTHTLLYQSTVEAIKLRGFEPRQLRELVQNSAFGEGVSFGDGMPDRPIYDGATKIDILKLIFLRYLSLSEPVGTAKVNEGDSPGNSSDFPFSEIRINLGQTVDEVLTCFTDSSSPELTDAMITLTSLRLYQFPFVTLNSLRHMSPELANESKRDDQTENNEFRMFMDFTRDKNSAPSRLSAKSIQKHIQLLNQFFDELMFIKQLELCVRDVFDFKKELDSLRGLERLVFILQKKSDSLVNASATQRINSVQDSAVEAGDEETAAEISAMVQKYDSPLDVLTRIAIRANGTTALGGIRKWVWAILGLRTDRALPQALLSGSTKSSDSWRYEPTDLALISIIESCFANYPPELALYPPVGKKSSMTMKQLLSTLESKYGILVATPPKDFDSAETRIAARENFLAFQSRLRKLGYFQGLSDDFAAQTVERPNG